MFQSALPVLLFAPHDTTLILKGGTDVQKSPSVDYMRYILLPVLKKHFGVESEVEVRTRGLSPHGGGELLITIKALEHKMKCISLIERGNITSFQGIIWTARQECENVVPGVSCLNQGNQSVGTIYHVRTEENTP